jgi:hypothetical protein
MKAFKTISYILLVIVIIFTGCSDDDPTERERVKKLLTTGGTWSLKSTVVDGANKTDLYSGFAITFSSDGYTAINGGVIWPDSGTWRFEQGSDNTLVFDEELTATIESISEKDFQLSFHRDEATFGAGRITSVSGEHMFVFSRP